MSAPNSRPAKAGRFRNLLLLVPAANVAVLIAWLAMSEAYGLGPIIVSTALSGAALLTYVVLGGLRPESSD